MISLWAHVCNLPRTWGERSMQQVQDMNSDGLINSFRCLEWRGPDRKTVSRRCGQRGHKAEYSKRRATFYAGIVAPLMRESCTYCGFREYPVFRIDLKRAGTRFTGFAIYRPICTGDKNWSTADQWTVLEQGPGIIAPQLIRYRYHLNFERQPL